MSIATAIEHAREKIKAVYTKCEEKGATLPEKQNLENLPACLDTIKNESQKINAYYYDSDTSANKKVLLTNVGYEMPIDEDFSTVRFSFITDNGWVGTTLNPPYSFSGAIDRYDVVNGVVEASTQTKVTLRNFNSISSSGTCPIPLSFLEGQLFAELPGSSSGMKIIRISSYCRISLYTYSYNDCGNDFYIRYGYDFLVSATDYAFVCTQSTRLAIINDDGSFNYYDDILSIGTSKVLISKDKNIHYYINPYDTSLYKVDTNESTSVVIKSGLTGDFYDDGDYSVFVQTKKLMLTDTGFITHSLSGSGFYGFVIDEQTPENSDVNYYTWASVVGEIGDRTIYKVQTYYDGTFSLDLNEGTTLMCRFISGSEVEVLEVIEPFIVPDDSTIYHRTFTPHKLYWYQRYADNRATAPLSSTPWGTYEPKEAVTNYLAVGLDESRFNSTILTGFLTGETVVEDGRQLVEVKTALPE